MRKLQVCLALLVCLVMATSASAAIVQVDDLKPLPTDQYTMISNNLIQSGSATLASQYNTPGPFLAEGSYGNQTCLNNGIISPGQPTDSTDIILMDGYDDIGDVSGPNPYSVYVLDLRGYP